MNVGLRIGVLFCGVCAALGVSARGLTIDASGFGTFDGFALRKTTGLRQLTGGSGVRGLA